MLHLQRCLLLLLFLSSTQSFKMPTLENIGDIFSNLLHSKGGETAEETLKETPKSRQKRQDGGIGDESNLPYEAISSSLPLRPDGTINSRYMPVLANGHIGVTVYNDTLHLNGLYAGTGGNTHRAKIPAAIMSRVQLTTQEQENKAQRKFKFNVKEGVFTEVIKAEIAEITHRLYVHNKYIRVLVSDIYCKKDWGGIINLEYPELEDNEDIDFGQRQEYRGDWKIKGQTNGSEEGTTTQSVSVFWMEPLRQISIRNNDEVREIMIMSVDKSDAAAQSDFDQAKQVLDLHGIDGLLDEHHKSWAKVWDQGKIEVESQETAIAKTVEFSQYYLLSSLSPIDPQNPPQRNEILYGAGRGSLGKGSKGTDYQGHVFWDSEMYIMPAVLLFHPEVVKKMLRYRAFHQNAAKQNAEDSGDIGYRFPWESAFSGSEVTPDNTCEGCAKRQIHITAAVGWAVRQYFSATRDREYITNPDYSACEMTREIARFFANRAVYNTSIGRYDIKDVMGPDDYHDHVDNNAYTNAAASLAIHWARYFACVCNRISRDEVPDEWIQKAMFLELPFSNVERLHYQYDGFNPTTGTNLTNKQADTILLTYPLNWNVSTDIMKNDLEYYETITSQDSPAMTWSFFALGFKWVNDEQKMISYFTRSYTNYLISPFKIWTEYNEQSVADQETGSVNYLPGMGAFLQSIVYGFAGVRIRPEALEFHNPQPPPYCNRVTLRGLNYLGANMTIMIDRQRAYITVHYIDIYPLTLRYNDTSAREESLTPGAEVVIEPASQGFYIFTTEVVSCDHPRDYIYMPWGYSPWISGSPTLLPSFMLLVIMLLVQRPL